MKILICEDEEIMLAALEFRLRKHGFVSLPVEDGRQAIQTLQQEMPDLIVADIMMPYVTGLELIHHVRNELNSQIPIIIISALDDDATVLEAFRLGANDFIAKPFKPNELILRIKKIQQDLQMA